MNLFAENRFTDAKQTWRAQCPAGWLPGQPMVCQMPPWSSLGSSSAPEISQQTLIITTIEIKDDILYIHS